MTRRRPAPILIDGEYMIVATGERRGAKRWPADMGDFRVALRWLVWPLIGLAIVFTVALVR